MIDNVPSEIKIGKVVESLRKDTFLKKSQLIVTLGIVDILGSEPIFLFLSSTKENKATALGEIFLETKETETLLEKCFAMQQVKGLLFEYTHLPALKIALESKLGESLNSPIY